MVSRLKVKTCLNAQLGPSLRKRCRCHFDVSGWFFVRLNLFEMDQLIPVLNK